jgi:Flp pilus assembly pilin Flp
MVERISAAAYVRLLVMTKSLRPQNGERGATATEYAIVAAIGVGVALAMWGVLSGIATEWVDKIGTAFTE